MVRPLGLALVALAVLSAPPRGPVAVAQSSAGSAADEGSGPARYVLTGLVTDAAGDFLPGVDVTMMGPDSVPRRAVTDERGRFTFADLTSARVTVRARRVGYQPATVTVLFTPTDTVASVRLALDAAAVDLPAAEIEAAGSKLEGFYNRARSNKFGRYFTREQIERSRRSRVSELLRGLPGVTVTAGLVRIRGCRPSVWMDGTHLMGAEIDDVTRLEDIAGLEEYASWAGLPPQFQDRREHCGALIVWTRDGGAAG